MNKMWNVYLSRAAAAFTASFVFTALFNMMQGNMQGNYIFSLELLGFIVVIEIIDYVMAKFQFKSQAIYFISVFTLMYLCFLAFSYFGNWFRFTIGHFFLFSLVFVILFLLLHLYYRLALKSDAANINNKLKKRNSK
nr:DUF3021 family protein [uncultured Caproiciproducens sp.]